MKNKNEININQKIINTAKDEKIIDEINDYSELLNFELNYM